MLKLEKFTTRYSIYLFAPIVAIVVKRMTDALVNNVMLCEASDKQEWLLSLSGDFHASHELW